MRSLGSVSAIEWDLESSLVFPRCAVMEREYDWSFGAAGIWAESLVVEPLLPLLLPTSLSPFLFPYHFPCSSLFFYVFIYASLVSWKNGSS